MSTNHTPPPLNAATIRTRFIQFFKNKNHQYVQSSSTIPVNDQTILFTIAGMTQFKDCLTGKEKRAYTRATNSQKCIRVGDLDDVGKDGRHLTMFEMLGSWSFGDYYKQEAIDWAYTFVRDELKLDLARFWATVHKSDDEAFNIWRSLGVPENRIVRLGDKDNFWAMGPTGPCGPCSELYLDQGPEVSCPYSPTSVCQTGPGCDCDRYLEFWNLVFMQFDRQTDGTLRDLPMKSVDTGMGLERVTALVQGKYSNFETDIFAKIRNRILELVNTTSEKVKRTFAELNLEQTQCVNVVSDHIRMLCFTIADGAIFSNEGRGYVLRRVLRRAVRYATKLCPTWNKEQSFMEKLVSTVVHEMGGFFPELIQNQKRIEELIRTEELKFNHTLESGLTKFQELSVKTKNKGSDLFSGEDAFILHDSFGFPLDLTEILCAEHGLKIDRSSFDKCMLEQKERSRSEAKFYKFDEDTSPWFELSTANQKDDTHFAGYFLKENFNKKDDDFSYYKKELLFTDIKKIRQLKNKFFEIVFANTPFYPEGGGQVSDIGFLEVRDQHHTTDSHLSFECIDVRKTASAIIHTLRCEYFLAEPSLNENLIRSLFSKQAQYTALVNLSYRQQVARNHTATHLMHKALQVVLGESAKQAGSLVNAQGLRFDFSYPKAMIKEQLEKVEQIVNEKILENIPVVTHDKVEIEKAKNMGAMAMFGEKYDEHVRVLQVDNFSLELCGGTHVQASGEIGTFKIISEGSVTSGVRRIEAITGTKVLEYIKGINETMTQASNELKCSRNEIVAKITALKDKIKSQEQSVTALQSKLAQNKLSDLLANSTQVKDIQIVIENLNEISVSELEILCDKLKEKNNTLCFLFGISDGKVFVVSGMNPKLMTNHKNIHIGNIVKEVCALLSGKGGGRPDFARGSGTDLNKIEEALVKSRALIEKSL